MAKHYQQIIIKGGIIYDKLLFSKFLNTLYKIFISGLLSFLMIGCISTTFPQQTCYTNLSWPKRLETLSHLTHWTVRGKMKIRFYQQSQHISLYWQQQGSHYHLDCIGPLGLGAVQITGELNRFVTLRRAGQPPITAKTPESLLQQQWGWSLPIFHLYYWIRGIPVPFINTSEMRWDAYHHLLEMKQDGWHVIYNHYKNAQGLDLPQHLVLTYENLAIEMRVER